MKVILVPLLRIIGATILTIIWLPFFLVKLALGSFLETLWEFKITLPNFTFCERENDFPMPFSPYNTDYYYKYATYFHYVWNMRKEEDNTD